MANLLLVDLLVLLLQLGVVEVGAWWQALVRWALFASLDGGRAAVAHCCTGLLNDGRELLPRPGFGLARVGLRGLADRTALYILGLRAPRH